jgi:hypothetical protein
MFLLSPRMDTAYVHHSISILWLDTDALLNPYLKIMQYIIMRPFSTPCLFNFFADILRGSLEMVIVSAFV